MQIAFFFFAPGMIISSSLGCPFPLMFPYEIKFIFHPVFLHTEHKQKKVPLVILDS